ncbi:MAG TPA: fibronectin type III domain-containing protein [Planctomycetota bacterium]|nr:fibronectin type III domain-containing protein [Planctomycetota bacterium]
MEGFSFSELILIIIVAIIIYGKDLPQAARKMATLYSKFKRQLNDVRDEIKRQIPMDELENAVKVNLPSGPFGDPPQTPYGLAASPSATNVLLTWNSSTGSTSYTVRRSTGPQDPWLIVAMNISELAWTDTDVHPGKNYHYVVTGVNETGESGNSDEVTATIPGGDPAPPALAPPAPAAPADLAAAAPVPPVKVESAVATPPNGNGDHPQVPPVAEAKGQSSSAPTPEAKPS